ncbi:MAG TPA: lamin tail domain-containing protein, partial [Pyrinomonadaceae bacterium]|nr:lamin tail domain-containing protein [Pyrinomonadaceae bacterium]
ESGNAVAVEDHLLGLSLAYGRAISDDGKRVVYSAEDGNHVLQIFLYDGKNDVTRQLTSFTDFNGDVSFQPTISGDGTRIAFATRRAIAGSNSDGSVELYVYDIPTAQFTRLTNAPSQAKAEIVSSLSDDGSVIAFNFPRIISGAVETAANSNNSEIYVSQIAPRPQYFDDLKILNGASFGNEASQETVVAPGSITVARGRALAIATEQAHPGIDGDFPISFLGTSVFVNGRRAQILFVSPTQVNFVLPDETVEGAAQVVVTNGDGFQSLGKALVSQAAPGLFTFSGDGRGDGVILDADTQSRGPFDPTNGQLRLNVFATGLRHAQHVSASLAGMNATVESIQQSTTLPGLDEIHLLLPSDIRGAGTMRLTVTCDGLESNSVTLMLAGDSLRDLLINEILADPPDGLAGDANHDGTRSSSQDEFVEIVNTTAHDINLTGYKLLSRSAAGVDGVRHTFAQGAILQAGGAVVIFGGGTPPVSNAVFGGATVLTASSASLGPLNNSGGVVTLIDNANRIVSFVSYGDAGGLRGDANQSLTRSPDITGAFALHQSASGSNGRAFSPGTHLDGTPFTTRPVYRVEIVPSASSIFINATQQFTARAFDSQDNEMSGLIFVWQSSSTAIANVNADGLATGLSEGAAEIRASTRGVQSAAAVLTVKPVPPVLTRIEVSPSNVTIPFGVTRSFTARAFDQLDREMSGISFTWSSGDTSVATIDQAGSASAIKPGASTITATAQNVKGETVLNVVEPALIFNEVLADPPGSSSTDLIGDANHDGVRDSGDEFIELVNQSSSTLNITGWTIRTR